MAVPNKVPRLRGEEFDSVVMTSDSVWLIAIVSDAQCGEPCDLVADVFQEVHDRVGDVVSLASVDAFEIIKGKDGEHRPLMEEHNITALPALLMYTYGPKKLIGGLKIEAQVTMSLVGRGPKTFMKNLRQFVPGDVESVRKFSIARFVGEDREPRLPRVLLIHTKKQTPLIYNRLSLQFDRRAIFGEMTGADEETLARFGITDDDLPALLMSPPGGEVDAEAESLPWTRHTGDMKYKSMAAFLMERVPEVHIEYLDSADAWDRACVTKGGVCFVAFMPEDDDARADLTQVYRFATARSYSYPNLEGERFQIVKLPVTFHYAIVSVAQPLAALGQRRIACS